MAIRVRHHYTGFIESDMTGLLPEEMKDAMLSSGCQ